VWLLILSRRLREVQNLKDGANKLEGFALSVMLKTKMLWCFASA
jgi:hypothetical protein